MMLRTRIARFTTVADAGRVIQAQGPQWPAPPRLWALNALASRYHGKDAAAGRTSTPERHRHRRLARRPAPPSREPLPGAATTF